MDLNLFLQVARRFKYLVVIGVLAAAALALLSYTKVSGNGITYRQPKLWASHEQPLVTQAGCPICQANPRDSSTFTNLTANAVVYANIASNEVVTRLAESNGGKLPGVISAAAVVSPESGTLPIIDIAGTATSPPGAKVTAQRGVKALRSYILNQQLASQVEPSNRIILEGLGPPDKPTVVRSPSITRPVFIFLAVLIAFLGVAFVLENLRPRIPVRVASRDNLVEAHRSAEQPTASRQSDRFTG